MSGHRPARASHALVLAAAVLTLTGCSQVAALAPVGGDRLSIIRFAANDVLEEQGVELLVAPVCTADGRDVTCRGSSLQGAAITVTSSTDDQAEMTVQVGDRTIYAGSVQDVIDAGARP
jgi:hypothetical protein